MTNKKHIYNNDRIEKLVEDVVDIASRYIPTASPSSDVTMAKHFVEVYYRNLSDEEGLKLAKEDLAGMALHHYTLLKSYTRKSPNIAVFNPTTEAQHFHTSHSVIQMVAYDRPFLVDTLLMSLENEGINVHRLFHTIIKVEWDAEGLIESIETSDNSDTGYISLIHCEIDRYEQDKLNNIQTLLIDKVNVLDEIVGDWGEMRTRLKDVKKSLESVEVANSPYSMSEVKTFLDWILDDHFIFLGYREYRLELNNDIPDLMTVGGSGLGLLGGITEDKRSESFYLLPDGLKHLLIEPQVLLLSKSSHVSPVHRPVYMDFLGIQKFDDNNKLVGEYRFIGLLTSRAYQLDATQIPLLREKTSQILAKANLPKGGHAYHKILHIINTLPRDDLFQGRIDELYPMVTGVVNLQDSKRLRLFTRTDHFQRFVSCLVYIPKAKFHTELRVKIQGVLTEAFGGTSSGFTTEFDESHHARVHIHVRTVPGEIKAVDVKTLEDKLTNLMQGWEDGFEHALMNHVGESTANTLINKYKDRIPASYQEQFDVRTAVLDIERLDRLDNDSPLYWHLYQSTGGLSNQLNLKVYGKGVPAMLSNVLPILERFGVDVMSAQTYEFGAVDAAGIDSVNPDDNLWMQEFELMLKHVDTVDMSVVRKQFEQSLQEIWQDKVESDSLNELILTTNLDTYDVVVLRALARYMQQARAPFSRRYIEQTLVKNNHITVLLTKLFDARMNPKYSQDDRRTKTTDLQDAIESKLEQVSSLDEDRILRWYLDLNKAMLRTNFYQRDDNDNRKDRLSFKFASSLIPNLPKPKPLFEIFVYSPRVEAIHLRSGMVARGGLRWSDRLEDFRTEVLGLVKAQIVKNTVIVPVGSKGGFIAKQANRADGREAFLAEGQACYRTFLRGMLDITDNIVDGAVVHPVNTVRYDGEDPYLVVAADKGTATFSDIANQISSEYKFWLDDAFASGGSVGYDHKAMGITARGAWESVKRHFRLEGMDIQHQDDFTVVGIGDMSGDVFGNGMLLSKHIQLQAAFNHLHIFIDPNPDPKLSFNERARLFELPRSTWEDYKLSLISEGGGIFSRSDKSIPISQQMRAAFDISEQAMTPNELINALLKAPVDLIWNGGIGTYIKSTEESHADVGDRANDAVRVNGDEVRATVIGEGGNLGCTQKGRIEYAEHGGKNNQGGRIYTDAIDNSGGVNCSDHEVNIKILLGKVVAQGDMTLKQRNQLLESMTEDVAELVLRQNYLQPQAIELSAMDASQTLIDHQRLIQFFEKQERLDRAIEFLPSDDEITRRQKTSTGLTNPELAVLLAYGKMWVYDELLASDLPDEPYFINELRKYFPDELAERFFTQMTKHRLHREIISTFLTNSVVNRLGVEAIFRLHENTDQSVATIVRAYTIARDVYKISLVWKHLELMDDKVDAKVQLKLEKQVRDVLESTIVWFINTFGATLNVSEMLERFASSVSHLTQVGGFIETQFATSFAKDLEQITKDGLSPEDAKLIVLLPYHIDALDAALFAEKFNKPVEEVATLYFKASDALEIDWMLDKANELPQQSYWDRRARYALVNELNRLLRQLMSLILQNADPKQALDDWRHKHLEALNEIKQEMVGLNQSDISLSVLSVLLSELNNRVT